MEEKEKYQRLKSDLQSFKQRYYLRVISNGVVLTLIFLILIFLTEVVVNQLVALNTNSRTILFLLGILMGVIYVGVFVLRPAAKWVIEPQRKWLRKANQIISKYYLDIEDKLLNIIELAELSESGTPNDLLQASIYEKSGRIIRYELRKSIAWKNLWLNGIIGVILIGVTGYLLGAQPNFVKQGIAKTVHYKQEFSENLEFMVNMISEPLETEIGVDFMVRVVPVEPIQDESVKIQVEGDVWPMNMNGESYEFTIISPNRDLNFKIIHRDRESKWYTLYVLAKPEVGRMEIRVIPPDYTKGLTEILENDGNLELRAGSNVLWNVFFSHISDGAWVWGSDTVKAKNDELRVKRKVVEGGSYELYGEGEREGSLVKKEFDVKVVPDLYPEILVSQTEDSTRMNRYFYSGWVQDDYGFEKLEMIVRDYRNNIIETYTIPVNKEYTQQNFFSQLNLNYTQQEIKVLFRIWDNDGVNGSKFTDAEEFLYSIKTKEQIERENQARSEKVEQGVSEGKDMIESMEERIDELARNTITKEFSQWEMTEKFKEMQDYRKALEEIVEKIKSESEVKTSYDQRFVENEALREKAEQIQKLFESIMDDEMKKLLEEFEKLFKERNGKMLDEEARNIELNLDQMKEKMDMTLELMKRYEVEKGLMEKVQELDKMSEQLDNQDKTEEGIEEDYLKWKEKMEELMNKNDHLKEPYDNQSVKRSMGELDKEMNGAKDTGGKKGSREQKKQSMSKVGKEIREMIGIGGGGQSVDIEELRQIIQSLNELSFKQESVTNQLRDQNTNSPVFSMGVKDQKELDRKFDHLADSIRSIGYKQPIVAQIVGEELFHVETSKRNLWKGYEAGRAQQVRIEQNKMMTGENEIAVKLDEIVKQAENQSAASSQGEGGFTDSKRKKDGGEKTGEMKSRQQSLKEQLKGMIQKMKQGGMEGGMTRDMAKMLAEREVMRRAMEELLNSGSLGTEAREKLNQALDMENEVEKDIIYNKLGDQTISKDEWIQTRLLEAENAEKERKTEERRESTEFRGEFKARELDGNTRQKELNRMREELRYRDVKLKEFYDKKFNEYIRKK